MAFKKFPLPCEDFNTLFTKEELNRPVVVVSIIGRTSIDQVSSHAEKVPNFTENVEELIGNIGYGQDKSFYKSCQLECYFDKEESVVYMSLIGPMNIEHLMATFRDAKEELEQDGFLNFWSKVKNSFARALLLMFSFSHIILLSSPSYTINTNIIQLFKVLSYVRPKYQAAVTKALGKCRGISEDWIFHGRLCSPRLIFLFKQCPYEISIEKDKDERIARVKKLEHSLEDQIYMALRKSRLVKNVCSRAFFSIAPNDEFVFVDLDEKREVSKDVELLTSFDRHLKIRQAAKAAAAVGSNTCSSLSSDESSPSLESFSYMDIPDCSPCSSENESSETEEIFETLEGSQLPGHSFKDFLMKHIRKAHNEGFSDNMGKYSNVKPFFEVPLLHNWLSAINMIMSEAESGLKESNSTSNQLEKLLGTELKYSSARCKKVLPLSLAIYQDNLPSHYNQLSHEKKVKQAVAIFSHHARGPAQQKFVDQLKEECDKIWKSGRQTCEALSLNKNSCTKPKHQTSLSPGHPQLGESEHWSGVQFYSSCNCGAKQGPRQDPFTLRAANYDFYQIIGQECGCIHLDKYTFPIFQPSTSDFKEADLSNPTSNGENIGVNIQEVQNEFQDMPLCSQSLSTGKLWNIQESVQDSDAAMSLPLSTIYFDQSNNLSMNYFSSCQQDKHLVRQASTTEYLPGMIHMESPLGLLPQFPSWSLLCRGPSSLYSHNLGLHDYPGFIPGSSYLLPWDVSFREKDICKYESELLKKPSSSTGSVQILKPGNRRNQRSPKEFISVKIFIGVEYECVRGHRFMSSAPGVVLKATGTGVKEDANKITEGNMPLFLPCPCGKVIAQLMRVHIVTPKAPVYVTIDPKVRPAPAPCPTFITGEQKPIPLSQSAYWVLRLPYVYASERKFFSVPSRMKNLKYGELLGPMYGITQDPDT